MRIGFIGLGIMGRPMARHLIDGGHDLLVARRRSPIPDELSQAAVCATARAVAEGADLVILMLPDTPDVEDVLFAADGVAAGLSPGKTVMDMSAIDPVATRRFAARIRDLGCDYVDAPVSGGEIAAKAGTLSIMVGAEPATFERVQPVLARMGSRVTHVGGVGDGQTAKVANQMVVGLTIAAVAEALTFAARAGADPARVRDALLGGFAASRVLDVHGQRMLDRAFQPGFSITLHAKDLALALSAGRTLTLPMPQTAACQQLLLSAIAQGEGGLDHAALFNTFARLANLHPEENDHA
ncbi:MAG: 2-hydroxy-3-oxopropionate reductase [Azospirillaceae bacterium]|nr:2-hydroxy-3-oxopropionate reductase [Azospirillaceae bacterium]